MSQDRKIHLVLHYGSYIVIYHRIEAIGRLRTLALHWEQNFIQELNEANY
jgi:hypothetical protein